jgi:hypothetical protein
LKTPPPPVELSCCGKLSQWCSKTVCCCCDNSKNQVHRFSEQIVTTISGKEAVRRILIIIEYIRYSNINTPSHIRVLGSDDQLTFYKERLHADTLQFYLLDNHDFENNDYVLKQAQAASLCRLVTQLKAMVGQYPDAAALEKIGGKRDDLVIGEPPNEAIGGE